MEELEFFLVKSTSNMSIPLFTMSVSAGYPVPVDEAVEKVVDLNEFLVEHPAATFFARIRGNNMEDVGLTDGDILIVDAAIDPQEGKLVIAMLGDKMTVKYYTMVNNAIHLKSLDNTFLPMEIEGLMEFKILGTVTKIIRSL